MTESNATCGEMRKETLPIHIASDTEHILTNEEMNRCPIEVSKCTPSRRSAGVVVAFSILVCCGTLTTLASAYQMTDVSQQKQLPRQGRNSGYLGRVSQNKEGNTANHALYYASTSQTAHRKAGEEGNGGRDPQHDLNDDTIVYVYDDYVDDYYAYKEDTDPYKLLPLTTDKVVGFMLAAMGLTLAAGGGIGGGGIVVPIYLLVFALPPKHAIPLGAVSVFGAAVASTLLNVHRRHPLADRPVIDWNLILVMEPLILMGALLGTLLHKVINDKLLVVLLVFLLCTIANATLSKAKRMYDAETRYIQQLREYHALLKKKSTYVAPPVHVPAAPDDLQDDPLNKDERQRILIVNPDFVSIRSELTEEERVAPRNKIMALLGMFSVLIWLNIMVGGGAYQSPWGIRCGGLAFWVVHVIMAAFLVASAWAAQTYLQARHEIKELVQFNFVHGDIKWDSRGAIKYPSIFCLAGCMAGMFGIGGGMIVVPLLLTLGVHPAVATATSSCMIVMTSFASLTSFAIFGLVMWDYAIVCLTIGFFASLFGQRVMQEARQVPSPSNKYGKQHNFERNSLIAYSIGGVVLLSALLMSIQYVFMIMSYDSKIDQGGICEGYQRGSV